MRGLEVRFRFLVDIGSHSTDHRKLYDHAIRSKFFIKALTSSFIVAGFNVGCAELMIDGKVGLKSGTEAVQFKPDGLVFADGSELDADVVIFATGYHNILHTVGKIFGEDTVKKTGQVWGLNEECEIRSAYRPCGVPGVRSLLRASYSEHHMIMCSFGMAWVISTCRGSIRSTW
jgi:hypothetical protein